MDGHMGRSLMCPTYRSEANPLPAAHALPRQQYLPYMPTAAHQLMSFFHPVEAKDRINHRSHSPRVKEMSEPL